MKTKNIIFPLVTLIFLINGCEKADEIDKTIKKIEIVTDKNFYNSQEMINASITNQLSDTAYHFKCDNHDLRVNYIVKKESDTWVEEDYPLVCTTMGPSGFWGVIIPSQTKNDSLKIDSQGKYKLKYTFIINSDTTDYLSNEFEIID